MVAYQPDTVTSEKSGDEEECLYTQGKQLESIPTILSSRKEKRGPNPIQLERPWRRFKQGSGTEAVMAMSRRNYKVYADMGITSRSTLRVCAVLDTGAGPNFVHRDKLPKGHAQIRRGETPLINDANGRPVNIVGTVSLYVRFGSYVVKCDFYVCEHLATSYILGGDFCDRFVNAIRPRKRTVELDDGTEIPIVRKRKKEVVTALNIPEELKDDSRGGRTTNRIRVAKATVLRPQRQSRVLVTTQRVGLSAIQAHDELYQKHGIVAMNGVVEAQPDQAFYIMVANYGKAPYKLSKNQNVGTIVPQEAGITPTKIPVTEVLGLESEDAQTEPEQVTPSIISEDEQESENGLAPKEDPLKELELEHLSDHNRQRLLQILRKYPSLYDGTLGEIRATEHIIDLTEGAEPIRQPPYRTGIGARAVVKTEVDKMLKKGVIEPATTPWASPVVLAPKKDGTYRFCVDYRRLNNITVRDSYPLPRMDDCIDSLGDAKYMSTLDCNSGYWQIPLKPSHRDRTTFVCHEGTFRFKRMPFGLTNGPATFQRALDIVLAGYKWQTCLVYLDDIIIFSKDAESHLRHVEQILSALHKANVTIKLGKCAFFTQKVRYLGHIIEPGKLSIDETVTKALKEAEQPRNKQELRSFLGLCNVYRRFVPGYTNISAPLNKLLKADSPDTIADLDEDQETAFRRLIDAVTSPPVLALPKNGLPYSVDTDASSYQVGAALFQTDEEGRRKPLGYWSRTLNAHEKNYSVSEKECLAVVWALTTLRPYLLFEDFIVHTDHASLRWLMNVSDPSGRLIRWRLRLSEFKFQIQYKKGICNSQADALSRLGTRGGTEVDAEEDEIPCFQLEDISSEVDESTLDDICALNPDENSTVEPITTEELISTQLSDRFCTDIRARLDRGERLPFLDDEQGILTRIVDENTQVVIPQELQSRLLHISHFAKTAGHPGGRKLYYTLRRRYYWPSMALDCHAVTTSCTECARERVKYRKNSTRMKLFPATAPLESVAIDILGELIRTKKGNRFLLVITDRFTKLTKTVPLKRITATAVAHAFVHHWVFHYGPPRTLLSDNGSQFMARFFTEVCRIMGTKNVYTTTYHPQCNGQVERFNRTILSALRSYLGDHPRDWDEFTSALTYAYNTQVHKTTGLAPFELVLSRPPTHLALEKIPEQGPETTAKDTYGIWLSRLRSLMSTARKEMHASQARYKRDFDKKVRLPRERITKGVRVFVRKDHNPANEPSHKLAPIATGPYQVTEADDKTCVIKKDGDLTERVTLDRVVLAPDIGRNIIEPEVGTDLSDRTERTSQVVEPDTEEYTIDKIVDHETNEDGSIVYRVRWYSYGPDDDTLEPIGHLPRSKVVQYHRAKKLKNPSNLDQARVG